MRPKLIKTEDGSHTLYIEEMDEQYHSIHGAIQESNHVFIEAGLKHVDDENIVIFEAGFGTALNALLTYVYAKHNNKKVHFHTIELYPIEQSHVDSLNYPEVLGEEYLDIFRKLHGAKWDTTTVIDDIMTITKHNKDLTTFKHSAVYNLIYFDAFAPDKQPHLWTEDIFNNIAQNTSKNGILTTYSAKGDVRRALMKAGFEIERIPGPPGKRQMMRGTKTD